jgi:hypothetical protein
MRVNAAAKANTFMISSAMSAREATLPSRMR